MRSRVLLAILVGTLAASQPVSAQVTNDTGIRTETQDRMRMQGQWEFPWDLLGLFGPVSYTHLTLPTNREV